MWNLNCFTVMRVLLTLEIQRQIQHCKLQWLLLVGIAVVANGCAVMPDSISPEIVHMSHATQHEPFTSQPTRYGVEILQVTAEWNLTKKLYLDLSEGEALEPRNQANTGFGEVYGPREQFTGKIGYKFTIPH